MLLKLCQLTDGQGATFSDDNPLKNSATSVRLQVSTKIITCLVYKL